MGSLFMSVNFYRTRILLVSLLAASILFGGCESKARPPVVKSTETARNIILLIGDGMGEAQRKAAQWQYVGQNKKLAMDKMQVTGWVMTGAKNDRVTDSAAAGTAMATGIKTRNRVVGKDSRLRNLESILEIAKAKGKSTGLVTTTQVTHATPASFAAHVDDRKKMLEIASQLSKAQVNVLLGGGEDFFLPKTETGCYPDAGRRPNDQNLINQMKASGYTYVCREASLNAVGPASTRYLLGLFADDGLVRPFKPSLATMTEKALSILSQNPNGFFLMVEGGQIDWAGHKNDAANIIGDTVSFDHAVAAVTRFASNRNDTLVIVTADHESGDMAIDTRSSGKQGEDGPFKMPDGALFFVNWGRSGHSAKDVPLSASGPGAYLLKGRYQNTRIYAVMRAVMD